MEKIVLKNDKAFKLGCGRLIQGTGVLKNSGDEILRLCKNPLVISGPKSEKVIRKQLESVFKKININFEWLVFSNPCSHEDAMEIASSFKKHDAVIGTGGGRVLDFAKLVASYANVPIITIPTSSATCACYTPLSVCYNRDGTTFGSTQIKNPVSLMILEMDILKEQPIRLLRAGAYDALAKYIEIQHRVNSAYGTNEYIGMRASFLLSEFISKTLNLELKKAENSVSKKENSKELEDIVYISTVGAGLCSGFVNGSKQCAIAHKFYEFVRFFLLDECKQFIHGELVAIGLIAQLYFNGEIKESQNFKKRLKSAHFPTCLSEMGVKPTDELFDKFYSKLLKSSALIDESKKRQMEAKVALKLLFK